MSNTTTNATTTTTTTMAKVLAYSDATGTPPLVVAHNQRHLESAGISAIDDETKALLRDYVEQQAAAETRRDDDDVTQLRRRVADHNLRVELNREGSVSTDTATPATKPGISEQLAASKPKRKPTKPFRANLFEDYSVSSIIRLCGQQGWTLDDTVYAVEHFVGRGKLAMVTFRLQHNAGRKGLRGKVANLSRAEYRQLVEQTPDCNVDYAKPYKTKYAWSPRPTDDK